MTAQEVSDKLDGYDQELLKLEIQTLKLEIKRAKVMFENIDNKDFLEIAKQKKENCEIDKDPGVIELMELQKEYEDLYRNIYNSKTLQEFIQNG